jgi:hypothetical protein
VIARYAGFAHRDAEVIAYCAEYVDEATNSGTIEFENGAMYDRISSAHKSLDYRNFQKLADHQVWIPFHFLPGNGGLSAGENPNGSFIDKIICRPDSLIARDMVAQCIKDQDAPYGLYRLGITMHVLADTWAHQGFAGVQHDVNRITALDDQDKEDQNFLKHLKSFFGDQIESVASSFVGDLLPLGHGVALSHPDKPFLSWSYRDHKGNKVQRNNTVNFTTAANEMCKAMQRYLARNPEAHVSGLTDTQRAKLQSMFANITDVSGDDRHKKWLKAIAAGDFGFPAQTLSYRGKGLNSWKHQALTTKRFKDKKSEKYPYHSSFMDSDWKHFHDALQVHRLTIIRDILPCYGICAA